MLFVLCFVIGIVFACVLFRTGGDVFQQLAQTREENSALKIQIEWLQEELHRTKSVPKLSVLKMRKK